MLNPPLMVSFKLMFFILVAGASRRKHCQYGFGEGGREIGTERRRPRSASENKQKIELKKLKTDPKYASEKN